MKSVFFMVLTFMAFNSAIASANPERPYIKNVRVARLVQFDLDPALQLNTPKTNINSGRITINFTDKLVTLSLGHLIPCPKNAMCLIGGEINELTVTLPMIRKNKIGCEIEITALKDQRPVDGIFQQLVVRDRSQCGDKTPVKTYVEYTTEALRSGTSTRSSFEGTVLDLMMF